MLRTIAILLFLLPLSGVAATMDEEIDYLLETVGSSSCTFVRNGKSYLSADAEDHLQMKRKRGKRYFKSTEEFIERLASKSSMSGKPYLIRCDDVEHTAKDWFTAVLEEYRQQ